VKRIYFSRKDNNKKIIRNIGTRVLSAVLLVGLLAGGILGQSGFSGKAVEAAENVKISAANFPDTNFREYILNNLDIDKDGYLSTEERGIKRIEVDKAEISSLEGIGVFSDLWLLSCNGNKIRSLDLSQNLKLAYLYCDDNEISELDISMCKDLYTLRARRCGMTNIILENNSRLTELFLNDNELESINVRGCTGLMYLHLEHNRLKELDVSKCESLWGLYCEFNLLTKLELKNLTKLDYLTCMGNPFKTLNISDTSWPAKRLYCDADIMKHLDQERLSTIEDLGCLVYIEAESVSESSMEVILESFEGDLSKLDSYYYTYNGLARNRIPKNNRILIQKDFKDEMFIKYHYSEQRDVRIYFRPYECTMINIITEPKNEVKKSGNAVFSVKAEGDGLTYQWYKRAPGETAWSKSGSPGNDTDTLSVKVLEERNGYQYRCLMKNRYGVKRYSNTVSFYYAKPVVITKHPEDVKTIRDKTVRFTVQAEGDGLTYQWYYKNSILDDEWRMCENISGRTTNTITVDTNAAVSGYHYRCEVKDKYGTIEKSKEATLIVVPFPEILYQFQNFGIDHSDRPVYIVVTANGENLSYQWQKKLEGETIWKNCTGESAKTNSYSFFTNLQERRIQYRCVITDSYGQQVISDTVLVVVEQRAKVTKEPKSVAAKSGNAVFQIEAEGDGLTYQWYWRKNDTSDWGICGFPGARTKAMTVEVISARNNYQYYCEVKDEYGFISKSQTAKLFYGNPATITKQPVNLNNVAGTTAKFTVAAIGDGLTYQWYWRRDASSQWGVCGFTGSKTNTMTVDAITARNGFNYKCVVTDKYGTKAESKTAVLTVKTYANITAQPKSVLAKSGNVNFTVSAVGDGLTYQWYWRKNASSAWGVCGFTGCKTNNLTVEVISARNGYQYRCAVKDKYGHTVYSEPATLTYGSKVVITKQPVSIKAKAGTTAKFTVTATGDGLTYQWYWRKNASSQWGVCGFTGSKTNAMSVEAITARNGYQYKCVVKDKYGNTVNSSVATFTVE